MTKYREILRLKSLGLSQQSIADSCNVSKKTVNRVLKRAKELNISWPLDKSDTDAVLAEMFFPSTKQVRSNKRMPHWFSPVQKSAGSFPSSAGVPYADKYRKNLRIPASCSRSSMQSESHSFPKSYYHT